MMIDRDDFARRDALLLCNNDRFLGSGKGCRAEGLSVPLPIRA